MTAPDLERVERAINEAIVARTLEAHASGQMDWDQELPPIAARAAYRAVVDDLNYILGAFYGEHVSAKWASVVLSHIAARLDALEAHSPAGVGNHPEPRDVLALKHTEDTR